MSIEIGNLLSETRKILSESEPQNVTFVGSKPWYERSFCKFKYAVVSGLLVGVVAGVGVSSLMNTPENNEKIFNPNYQTLVSSTPQYVADLRSEYPDVNFSKMENKRDIAKEFVGKNNFIALAAEMEGFRGDLHKDPGMGLNIGFGYNITKRVGNSSKEVESDLLAVGISKEKVTDIIKLAKLPQNELDYGIHRFNKKYSTKKLIDIEQGVALLNKTQGEYKKFASLVFQDSFHKMKKNQQEVLTYAAYKVGMTTLAKYEKAIINASKVYAANKQPTTNSLKLIAKELTFFYSKDGKEKVIDHKASLIAHAFMHQDYLNAQLGEHDKMKNSMNDLVAHKIDFNKELKNKKEMKQVKSNKEKIRSMSAKASTENNKNLL